MPNIDTPWLNAVIVIYLTSKFNSVGLVLAKTPVYINLQAGSLVAVLILQTYILPLLVLSGLPSTLSEMTPQLMLIIINLPLLYAVLVGTTLRQIIWVTTGFSNFAAAITLLV